jgi:hypothetical protein
MEHRMNEVIRISPFLKEVLKNQALLSGDKFGVGKISPEQVEANSKNLFTITYTAGKQPLKTGDGICLRIPQRGWSAPSDDPGKEGFIIIETDSAAELKLSFPNAPTDYGTHWITVKVTKGAINESEHIFIYYGGKGKNAPGAEVQNFDSEKIDFYMSFGTKPFPEYLGEITSSSFPGYPVYPNRLEVEPAVKVVGATAKTFNAVLPSRAGVNEKILLKLRLMDACQNPASYSDNKIIVQIKWDTGETVYNENGEILTELFMDDFHQEMKLKSPGKEDIYYLILEWNEKVFYSNPMQTTGTLSEQIYWGDLHAQGAQSDGEGEPENYFTRARDNAFMDVSVLTDHSDGLCFPVMIHSNEYRDNKWDVLCNTTENFNQETKFITFPAMEISSDVKKYPSGNRERNHRNAMFFDENDSVCFNWREFPDAEDWYRLMEKNEYMIIPHTHSDRLDCRYHNPFSERIIEIMSDKGSGEYFHNPKSSATSDHGGVLEFLKSGYRVGFVGSGDYHHNTPGRHFPLKTKSGYACAEKTMGGYAAIISSELTRRSIWSSMYNRQTYATTGTRIILDFNMMLDGEIIKMSNEKVIDPLGQHKCSFKVNYALTAPLKAIELIRNGDTENPAAVYTNKAVMEGFDKSLYTGEVTLEDSSDLKKYWLEARYPPMLPHKFIFYYIRIIQEDGEIAWSSPIWLSDRDIMSQLNRTMVNK